VADGGVEDGSADLSRSTRRDITWPNLRRCLRHYRRKTKSAALANELHDVQEANVEEIDDQATQLDDVQAMPLQSWSPNKMNISNNHANGSTRDINDSPPAPKKRKKTNDGDWQNIDPALLLLSGISAKTNLQLPIDVTAAQSTQSIRPWEMHACGRCTPVGGTPVRCTPVRYTPIDTCS
jgi:hypothetical protein